MTVYTTTSVFETSNTQNLRLDLKKIVQIQPRSLSTLFLPPLLLLLLLPHHLLPPDATHPDAASPGTAQPRRHPLNEALACPRQPPHRHHRRLRSSTSSSPPPLPSPTATPPLPGPALRRQRPPRGRPVAVGSRSKAGGGEQPLPWQLRNPNLVKISSELGKKGFGEKNVGVESP